MYATSRVRATDRLTAEFGVRWDEQTYGADADDQFVPRFNLAFDATATTSLRLSWGKYQQAQSINELQIEDGVTSSSRRSAPTCSWSGSNRRCP